MNPLFTFSPEEVAGWGSCDIAKAFCKVLQIAAKKAADSKNAAITENQVVAAYFLGMEESLLEVEEQIRSLNFEKLSDILGEEE